MIMAFIAGFVILMILAAWLMDVRDKKRGQTPRQSLRQTATTMKFTHGGAGDGCCGGADVLSKEERVASTQDRG